MPLQLNQSCSLPQEGRAVLQSLAADCLMNCINTGDKDV